MNLVPDLMLAVNYCTTHTLERWTFSVQCNEAIVLGRTDNNEAKREDWVPSSQVVNLQDNWNSSP